MLERVTGAIRKWRLGAVTGQGLTENNLKMMSALLAPFLGMWFFIKLFLPDEMYDLSVTIAMLVWLVWVLMLWSWAKSDAGNYICFPQSKWKFQDGTCRTFDLKVPPDSWERIGDPFGDGAVAYKVFFSEKYLFEDLDMPFPRVFSGAYWLLPARWDEAFQRRAFGEFFHKGVYVTKPDCEDISVYVIGWETLEGETYPICIINDCAFTYEKMLETAKHMSIGKLARVHALQTLFADARKKSQKLGQHTAYLEDRVEVSEKDSSKEYKKSADERMKGVRSRHASIMSVKEPLLTRLLNLKNVVLVILVVAIIYFFGNMVMHWW